MLCRWESLGWDEFFSLTKNRRLVLWGAGERCRKILPYMKRKFGNLMIVDRNKSGQYIDNVLIEPPELLRDLDDVAVLACGRFADQIRMELLQINERIPCYSEFWIEHKDYIEKYSRLQPNIDPLRVKNICSLMEDDESKLIINSIAEKRLNGIADYGDIMTDVGYFPRDLFEIDNNEVFVDCGAFNGDTIREFVDNVGDFKRIIAYEADPNNCEIIKQDLVYCLNKDKIDLYNLAVSDTDKEVCFNSGIGASSYMSNLDDSSFAPGDVVQKPISIRAVSLDEHIKSEHPTFIKMDIEGSELEALRGAQKTIEKYHPKLAICIYHKENDFLDIPELIHEFVPEYKLYVRHQGVLYFDTVLFAKV